MQLVGLEPRQHHARVPVQCELAIDEHLVECVPQTVLIVRLRRTGLQIEGELAHVDVEFTDCLELWKLRIPHQLVNIISKKYLVPFY